MNDMQDNPRLEALVQKNLAAFDGQRLNCAEAVLLTLAEYYGWDTTYIPRIATPFGGGLGGTQRTCGALSGGLMALGIRYGREEGGDKAPAYDQAKALIARFQSQWGEPTCRTLTGADFTDPEQMAAFRAPGGRHQTLCEGLVGDICRYIVGTKKTEGAR